MSSSVASAVTGLVQDGIAALRSPTPAAAAAAPAPRGVLGRMFDFLAAPIATAAVSIIPSMAREAREREAERTAARERAVQATFGHIEAMAKHRGAPAPSSRSSAAIADKDEHRAPAVPHWQDDKMPAPASAEVKVCDPDGRVCALVNFSRRSDGRIVARTKDGKRARCSVDRDGQLKCVIGRRTLTGPVKH